MNKNLEKDNKQTYKEKFQFNFINIGEFLKRNIIFNIVPS